MMMMNNNAEKFNKAYLHILNESNQMLVKQSADDMLFSFEIPIVSKSEQDPDKFTDYNDEEYTKNDLKYNYNLFKQYNLGVSQNIDGNMFIWIDQSHNDEQLLKILNSELKYNNGQSYGTIASKISHGKFFNVKKQNLLAFKFRYAKNWNV